MRSGQITLYASVGLGAAAVFLSGMSAANAGSGTVTVLMEDADQPTAEESAFESVLVSAGFTSSRLEPQAFAASGLDPAASPLLALDQQGTTLPAPYLTPEFGGALRAYLEAGGRVLFLGTAAEVLDAAEITSSAFTIQSFTGNREIYVRIAETDHPITQAYSPGAIFQTNGGILHGAFLTTPPAETSHRFLGIGRWNYQSCCGVVANENPGGLVVLHHGDGTITSLGNAKLAAGSPTEALRSLVRRVANYTAAPELGGLHVTFGPSGAAFSGVSTTLTATVKGVGGVAVPGASLRIQVPAGSALLSGAVDGVPQPQALQTYLLGDVASGETRTVAWTVSPGAQGPTRYTVDAVSTLNRVRAATVTVTRHVHLPGAVDAPVALLDADASAGPTTTALRTMGWTVDRFVPQDVDEGLIDPASHPVLVLPYYGSALPLVLSQASFGAGLRAYLEAGGDLVLLGTAAEVLDATGITPGAISIRTTGTTLADFVRITDSNHPVTAGLSGALHLVSGPQSGAILDTVDPAAGIKILGVSEHDFATCCGSQRAVDGNGLYLVPYRSGKAYALATGSFGAASATDAFSGLVLRIVDDAQVGSLAHLRLPLDAGAPSRRLVETDVSVRVGAHGGGSAPGVTTTLTLPPGATLVAAAVDGVRLPSALPTVSLGGLASGEEKRVTWTLTLANLGLNDVAVVARSADSRVPTASVAGDKFNHVEGTVGERIALVSLGDAVAPATRVELQAMGYTVDLVSTYDFDTKRITPALYPTTLLYSFSASLPAAFTLTSFLDGLRSYVAAGGDVVLLGSAGELLDSTGITTNAFTIRSTSSLANFLRVANSDHAVADGFAGIHQLGHGTQAVATLDVVDPTRGFSALGTGEYDYPTCCGTQRGVLGTALAVVPYEAGRAYALGVGNLGGNAPTDALRTLMLRILDAAEADSTAIVRVLSDWGETSVRGEETTVTARLVGTGGGVAPGVTLTVALPPGATLLSGAVNGVAQPIPLLTYAVGDVASGTTSTVSWTVKLSGLGANDFPLTMKSTSPRVPAASDAPRKWNHPPGALDGRIAVLDAQDGRAGALVAALASMGYRVDLFSVHDLDEGRLAPSAHSRLVAYNYAWPLPVTMTQPSFASALRDYLEAGGHVLLLGTAGEVLDVAGITPGVVSQRTTGNLGAFLRITDTNHAATEGFGGLWSINSGPQLGTTLDVVDPSRGGRILGTGEYDQPTCCGTNRIQAGNAYFLLPHANGKVAGLGTGIFGQHSPQTPLFNVVLRTLDAFTTDGLALLRVEVHGGEPAETGALTHVEATVTAHGGGSVPAATATLTVPSGATLHGGLIDGEREARALPRYELGSLASGESRTVRWETSMTGIGLHDFVVRAESHSSRVPVVTASARKDVHRPGALGATIALVDLQDSETAAIRARLEFMGWSVRTFTPAEIKAGALHPSSHPVLVAHSVGSALPAALSEAGFVAALKTYLEASGGAALLGGSGKLLDLAGYTSNAFTIRQVGSLQAYFDALTTAHPILEGFGGQRQTNAGNQYGATVGTMPAGGTALARAKYLVPTCCGTNTAEAGIGLGTLATGAGRAVFASTLQFSSNAPTDDAQSYLSRILDHLLVARDEPRTTATLAGAAGKDGWFASPVEVKLAAIPGAKGDAIIATHYRIGAGGAFAPYAEPFTVGAEGTSTVEAYSVDSAGRQEAVRKFTVRIDRAPPAVSFSVGIPKLATPTGLLVGSTTKLTVTATDALSGVVDVRAQRDSEPMIVYTVPVTLTGLADGSHTVKAAAKDRAGNAADPALVTLELDSTPPVTNLGFGVPGGVRIAGTIHASKHTRFLLSASDAVAGVRDSYYRVGDGAAVRYTGAFTLPVPDGRYDLAVWSVDRLDNVEIARRFTLVMDSSGPDTLLNLVGPSLHDEARGITYLAPATEIAIGSEAGATIQYRVNGGALVVYENPFRFPGAGRHRIDYWAVDSSGNAGPPKDAHFIVDATPPGIAAATVAAVEVGGTVYLGRTSAIELTATDLDSGVASLYWRTDGGDWRLYVGPFAVEGMSGPYVVEFHGADAVGNVAPTGSLEVFLDITRPTVSAKCAAPTACLLRDGAAFASAAGNLLLDAADGDSGVEGVSYSFDGGATWLAASGGIPLPGAEGWKEVRFTAVDRVGNQAPVATLAAFLDTTPPSATATLDPVPVEADEGFYVPSGATLTLAAADPASGGGSAGVARIEFAIDGDASGEYGEPLRFASDGRHAVEYSAVDAVGNREAERSIVVLADHTAPTSDLAVGEPSRIGDAWFVGPTTPLEILADDPVVAGVASGVASRAHRVSGGPWTVRDGAFLLDGDTGPRLIEHHATDAVGNAGPVVGLELLLDATPPVTTAGCGDAPGCALVEGVTYLSASGRLLLDATDGHSGVAVVRVGLDGAVPEPYADGVLLPGDDGPRAVAYFAEDHVRNREALHALAAFLDSTPPLVAPRVSPGAVERTEGIYVGPGMELSLEASDPLVGGGASGLAAVLQSVNGDDEARHESPLRPASDGAYAVRYHAFDAVANRAADAHVTLLADHTPPVTRATVGEPRHESHRTFVAPSTPISLEGEDPVVAGVAIGLAAIERRVDAGDWELHEGDLRLAGPDGERVVERRGIDAIGNVEAPREIRVFVDGTPPGIVIAGADRVLAPTDLVTVTAADPAEGGDASGVRTLEASLDDGEWFAVTGPFAVSDRDGRHVLRIRASDFLGNAAETEIDVFVDGTAPLARVVSPERGTVFGGLVVLGGDEDGDRFPTAAEAALGSDPRDPLSTPLTREATPPLEAWIGSGDLTWVATDEGVEARGTGGSGRLEAALSAGTPFVGATLVASKNGVARSVALEATTARGAHHATVPLGADAVETHAISAGAFAPPIDPEAPLLALALLVEAETGAYPGAALQVRSLRAHALRESPISPEDAAAAVAAIVAEALVSLPPAPSPEAPDASPGVVPVREALGGAIDAVEALAREHLGAPLGLPRDESLVLGIVAEASGAVMAAIEEASAGALERVPPPPERPVAQRPEAPGASAPVPLDFFVAVGPVPIRGEPTDPVYHDTASGVAAFEATLDGRSLGRVEAAPFAIDWDATAEVGGLRDLTIAITDRAGHLTRVHLPVLVIPASPTGVAATAEDLRARVLARAEEARLTAEREAQEKSERVKGLPNEVATSVEQQFPLVLSGTDPGGFRVRDDDLDGVPAVWGRTVTVTVGSDGSRSVEYGAFGPTGLGDPDDQNPLRRAPGEWPQRHAIPDPTGFRLRDDDLDGIPSLWAREVTVEIHEDGTLRLLPGPFRPTGLGDPDDGAPLAPPDVPGVPALPAPPGVP